MLERIEAHNQALAVTRMLHRPHSTIKFANNGQFELDRTYFERGMRMFEVEYKYQHQQSKDIWIGSGNKADTKEEAFAKLEAMKLKPGYHGKELRVVEVVTTRTVVDR